MADQKDARLSLTEAVYEAERVEQIATSDRGWLRPGYTVHHRVPRAMNLTETLHMITLEHHAVMEPKLLTWYLALNEVTGWFHYLGNLHDEYIPERLINEWVWRPGLLWGYCAECRLLQWMHEKPMIRPVFPAAYFPSQNQIMMMEKRGYGEMGHYL